MISMREKIARAIYNKATRLDGDQIAVHLGNSMIIDGSARDANELKMIVMQVCEDAADAILEAMEEPTEGMRASGRDAIEPYVQRGLSKPVSHQWQIADEVFSAMIQAAREGK